MPWFRLHCEEMEEEAVGIGRFKHTKQIVANMILDQLALRGYSLPEEFAGFKAIHKLMDDAGWPTYSFVVLVNELCKQYRLDTVEYEVMADPAAGLKTYTVKARIGYVERVATGPTKRAAQQLAAEQIYRHLRTRLCGTGNFNETEAIYRAYEHAMASASDEELSEERRREEDEMEAARQLSRKKGKKTEHYVDLKETVRLEMEHSLNGSHEVGPQPSCSAANEQVAAAARENAANGEAESVEAAGGEAAGGEAMGAEAAAAPIALFDDHEKAVRFISRTMERLGI